MDRLKCLRTLVVARHRLNNFPDYCPCLCHVPHLHEIHCHHTTTDAFNHRFTLKQNYLLSWMEFIRVILVVLVFKCYMFAFSMMCCDALLICTVLLYVVVLLWLCWVGLCCDVLWLALSPIYSYMFPHLDRFSCIVLWCDVIDSSYLFPRCFTLFVSLLQCRMCG